MGRAAVGRKWSAWTGAYWGKVSNTDVPLLG